MNTDIWRPVAASLESARGIAWDGCHKIYVLLDDEQVSITRIHWLGITKGGTNG